MMAADLTVVVPTYNGARHLKTTLDSLSAQTSLPSVIVVDDGSRDESVRIARAHDVVSEVLMQPNRGVAAARNRGLAIASSRYVAFLDQDDLWHPSRTSVLLELASTTGAAAVGTTEQPFALTGDKQALHSLGDERASWNMVWIDEGTESVMLVPDILGSDLQMLTVQRLMQGAAAVTTSFMYDRESAIVAGGCAPFVRAADDHVLNVNIAAIFGPIPRLHAPSLFYRVHPEATTQVSPLVLPLLTLQLAMRHGRALPSEADLGPNLEHLVWQIADQKSLSRSEQFALLTLSTARGQRRRWQVRWARRVLRRGIASFGRM